MFAEGKKHIPNASSSLIRTASYNPCPPFIARGKGARILDEDENVYLDFNLAYGCLINGHAPAEMVKEVSAHLELGFHFASPTELEVQLRQAVQEDGPERRAGRLRLERLRCDHERHPHRAGGDRQGHHPEVRGTFATDSTTTR